MGKMNHYEDDEQRALITWAKLIPILRDLLYANANGGKRGKIEAARLIGLGVMKGVLDLTLPVGRGGYFGLYIEMKKPRYRFRSDREAEKAVSSDQISFSERVTKQHYLCKVCYGWLEAKEVLEEYLNLLPTLAGQVIEE